MALAPFQMSLERAEVVDFTKPFMTKGTTVVIKRPEQTVWMFQFLSPLNQAGISDNALYGIEQWTDRLIVFKMSISV